MNFVSSFQLSVYLYTFFVFFCKDVANTMPFTGFGKRFKEITINFQTKRRPTYERCYTQELPNLQKCLLFWPCSAFPITFINSVRVRIFSDVKGGCGYCSQSRREGTSNSRVNSMNVIIPVLMIIFLSFFSFFRTQLCQKLKLEIIQSENKQIQ